MNRYLELSLEYANQKSYLDDLFRVYPTIPEGIREIDSTLWNKVENSFKGIFRNLLQKCIKPKQTNRQIGTMFKNWVESGVLGLFPVELEEFTANNNDAILKASDAKMEEFAKKHLNYHHDKGLDFIARFNGKYVIGEAKFLTDFGGHQNAQFNDAIATLNAKGVKAITIAILDGVLYIPGRNNLYTKITTQYQEQNILSALVLREFLYQL